jgi:hypothetical protein
MTAKAATTTEHATTREAIRSLSDSEIETVSGGAPTSATASRGESLSDLSQRSQFQLQQFSGW